MGFMTGNFPPVDPATFMDKPYQERLKTLTRHWVEYGFGSPKVIMVMYLLKLVFFYVVGGVLVATLTSHLNPLDPSAWFFQPIFYEKAVLWTVLLECLGFAGSWGPLAGHFKPMSGGVHYYARPGTIRLAPWPGKVPFTKGDERTPVDVLLYLGLLAALVVSLALPGVHTHGIDRALASNHGLVAPAAIIAVIVLLVTLGLRDKVMFIAARSEQYLPALIFMAFFPFVDMILAAKLLIVVVWFGAGFSKCNRHFPNVLGPMVSNVPWLPSKKVKRMHYANFPEDLRPSKLTYRHRARSGHVRRARAAAGPAVLAQPLRDAGGGRVHDRLSPVHHLDVPARGAAGMERAVHVPHRVPVPRVPQPARVRPWRHEHPPAAGHAAGLLFFPVLGNLRPDLVSFLPSMRQYAGNWASAMWAFAPGAEQRLDERIVKAAPMQKDQLQIKAPLLGYDEPVAEILLNMLLAWRSMHSQARGLNSVMMRHLGQDIDTYTLREAEFSCNAIVGFNFGDGHLHDQSLINAIQKRCQFAPGEFTVVWVESEPVWHGRQQYWVMDAAVGMVERGSWAVKDAVQEIPWLPDGPIPVQVDWRLEGYERVSHSAADVPPASVTVPQVAPVQGQAVTA